MHDLTHHGADHAHLALAAILLIGGDKTGDDRWYDPHLDTLKKEGLIEDG